jgi:pimeloyl-ACP methyl ester carboxylesterase
LCNLKLDGQIRACKVPGPFMNGDGDSILPFVIKSYPDKMPLGKGKFVIIDKSGHLPIIEKSKRLPERRCEFS